MSAPPTRIVLVDDHPLVRTGLGQLLAHDGGVAVVGSAGDGLEAQAVVAEQQPDLVLMDISMPVMDGIEATRRLRADHPELRVVMLTSFSDRERILEAIDAGASGYLLKDAAPDEIRQAIDAAVAGGSPLDPRAATALVQQRQQDRGSEVTLTPREGEVLECLCAGMANKAIARRLGIAEKTVKAHLTRVFQAIGVSDRTQAVLWAKDHGLA